MGATREFLPRRHVVAGVASTVVISLTALTSGLAPAVADPSAPTTTVAEVPVPRDTPSQQPTVEAEVPTAATQPVPKPARTPEVTASPPAPVEQTPVQEPSPTVAPAPVTVAPAPQTTVAPKPSTTTVAEPTTRASAPAPVPTSTSTSTSKSTPAPKPTPSQSAVEPTSVPPVSPTDDRPAPVDRVTEPPTPDAVTSTAQVPAPETTLPAVVEATPTVTGKPTETETSSTVAKAARPIETLRPQTLDAPESDVELARHATPVEEKPAPAPQHDVAALAVALKVTDRDDSRVDNRDWNRPDFQPRGDSRHDDGLNWDRKVRQWRPDWVQYDEYYRPMIFNPYRDPVRVVYMYQNSPRIVQINPLQRVIMYAADLAAYSFTAVVVNALNTAVNVAVGSFFGGGYIPAVGMAPPPPPPPVLRYDNVPVQVRYSSAVYEPFRVQRVVDVGDDTRYGERKVLLDGVTPAWGVWTQSGSGERQFEVHRTQQFPGLDDPREAPLPGDYRMQLVSGSTANTASAADSGLDRNQVYLIAAAVACSVLSLGAVGLVVLMGRRRGM